MHSQVEERRDYRFTLGLLTGTLVGAGLAMWLVPRAAGELRDRATDTATRIGKRASERYREAADHVGEVVDEVTRKGQSVRDNVADAVAHSAREVERYATAAKTDQAVQPGKPAVAPR